MKKNWYHDFHLIQILDAFVFASGFFKHIIHFSHPQPMWIFSSEPSARLRLRQESDSVTGGRGHDSPMDLFPVPAPPRGLPLLTSSRIPELMIRVHLFKIGLKLWLQVQENRNLTWWRIIFRKTVFLKKGFIRLSLFLCLLFTKY